MRVPFPEELASRIIWALVDKKVGLFAAYPDLTKEDLRQHAMIGARADWRKYKPEKAAPQTWIQWCAMRDLLDLSRSRMCELHRIGVVKAIVAARSEVDERAEDGMAGSLGGDAETVEDWLGITYRSLVRVLPQHEPGPGPKGFSIPQRAAVGFLMRRHGYSCRKMAYLLKVNPDLRAAVRMKDRTPSMWWCYQALRFLTESLGESRRRQVAALRKAEPAAPNNRANGKWRAAERRRVKAEAGKAQAAREAAERIQEQGESSPGRFNTDTRAHVDRQVEGGLSCGPRAYGSGALCV